MKTIKTSYILLKYIQISGIILFFLCLINCSHTQKDNLVTNNGFELGEGEEPEGWSLVASPTCENYHVGICNNEYHSGTSSYEISRVWFCDKQKVGIGTKMPITINPNQTYLLSFWYKTRNIIEYPLPLVASFVVNNESSPTVNYRKNISNTDEWTQYFVLLDNIPTDAKNAEIQFYCMIGTEGSIWIDDIVFTEVNQTMLEKFEAWRRQPIPETVGNTKGIKFEGTGFYRVEKGNERWWYVDPAGNPTWAISTLGESLIPSVEIPATQSTYFKEKYGNDKDDIVQNFYNLFEDLGFNSFAGWTDKTGKVGFADLIENKFRSGRPYFPMTHVIQLSAVGDNPDLYAKNSKGEARNQKGHHAVDPFNPEWRKLAREKAESIIPKYKNKAWFSGWFVDNEMDYENLFKYVWGNYSALEFKNDLIEKYKSIDSLNHAWSSQFGEHNYSSFEEIIIDKPSPKDWDDPLWSDFAEFERKMVKTYIDFTYGLVKELDPNHLIISNRLHLNPMHHLYRTIDLWGKYDVVCMNIYPDNNIIGFNPGEIEIMQNLHRATGRPILIGEWSVPAIDSRLYEFGVDSLQRQLDWSWPQVLRTQKERGEGYDICVKQLSSLDFMIGSGWFKTFDVDSKTRRANRGIMNTNYEPYTDLTEAIKKANDDIKTNMGLE